MDTIDLVLFLILHTIIEWVVLLTLIVVLPISVWWAYQGVRRFVSWIGSW